jgi:SAM-dependent methyltransferase
MTDASGVAAHYDRLFDEDQRLSTPEGRVELIRTRELLEPYLDEVSIVVDIGGATGVHAAWLRDRSIEVQLLDLSRSNVVQAAERGIASVVGDARFAPYPSSFADGALLLGPLYHLIDPAERQAALQEARRVTRPGGFVVVAAISRFAGVIDNLRRAEFSAMKRAELQPYLDSGIAKFPGGLADVYFHEPSALVAELEGAGLTSVALHGVEGPGWLMLTRPDAEDFVESALEAARAIGDHPSIVGCSSHLLAFGRVPA